tara:strand:- start:2951 stop:3814 length:864 start_codon:yes stop_codon:yes gene_type:complete
MSLQTNKLDVKTSYKNKKILEKEIPKLNQNEFQEVFNIIRQNNSSKYSENSRGVYINLKFLDDETITKIINFIQYTKNYRKNIEDKKKVEKTTEEKRSNNENYKGYTLDKESIETELLRLKTKKNENFTFQNFLDKLSITNIKQFEKTESKINYPQLKHSKAKFGGVKARVLKKCRDVNKNSLDLPFIPTDNVSLDDKTSMYSYDSDDESRINKHSKKSKLNKLISKDIESEDFIDESSQYNENQDECINNEDEDDDEDQTIQSDDDDDDADDNLYAEDSESDTNDF